MFVVGFATAAEIAELEANGFEIEDATKFGCVATYTASQGPADEAVEPEGFLVRGDGYLMTKPEPGPDGTQAIAVFLSAALYEVLLQLKEEEPSAHNHGNCLWCAAGHSPLA